MKDEPEYIGYINGLISHSYSAVIAFHDVRAQPNMSIGGTLFLGHQENILASEVDEDKMFRGLKHLVALNNPDVDACLNEAGIILKDAEGKQLFPRVK